MKRQALMSFALVSLLASASPYVFARPAGAADPAFMPPTVESATTAAGEPSIGESSTPAALQGPLFCDNCGGEYHTATEWGMGLSCSLAFQDMCYKLDDAAMAFCQSIGQDFRCGMSIVVTTQCFWNGNAYEVHGWQRHGCASFC